MNKVEKFLQETIRREVNSILDKKLALNNKFLIKEFKKLLSEKVITEDIKPKKSSKISNIEAARKMMERTSKRNFNSDETYVKSTIPEHLLESLSGFKDYESNIEDEMIKQAEKKSKNMKNYSSDPILNEILNSVTTPIFNEGGSGVRGGMTESVGDAYEGNYNIGDSDGELLSNNGVDTSGLIKDYSLILKKSREKKPNEGMF